MKNALIKTKDKESADKLVSLGFQLISQDSGIYTFINDGNIQFTKTEELKFTYSNVLHV